MESDVEADLRHLLAAVRNDDPAAALAALGLLRGLRDRLDAAERSLIEAARAGGASWASIAGTLGLASRQAAEQRFLRLTADRSREVAPARATRKRQRSVDARHGPEIADLRSAARALLRRIEADDGWDRRFVRAALARDTLRMAADAPPGALYALASQVVDDLAGGPDDLPPALTAAAAGLKTALT